MKLDFIIPFFRDGGPVMIPIAVTGWIMWALIVERLVFFRRRGSRKLAAARRIIDNNLSAPNAARSGITVLEQYASIAVNLGALRSRNPNELFQEAELAVRPVMMRHVEWIRLLAVIAPLLGLLGTVSGMITTFQALNAFATSAPKALSEGISAAMLTTQAGLVVAIPGLVFHSIFTRRIERLTRALHTIRAEVVQYRQRDGFRRNAA